MKDWSPITIVIGFAITLIVSMGGAIYAAGVQSDAKLEAKTDSLTKSDTSELQRIATLEEAIRTLKSDNVDIKSDLKAILKAVK